MKWRTLIVLGAVLVLVACSGDDRRQPGPDAQNGSQPGDVFAEFPECDDPRPGRDVEVKGLLLPDETHIYSVRRQGPITTVQGFIMMTPIEVREYYESNPEIQILVGEDEIIESELLFTNGEVRNFVKARAACRDGSDIVTVIAREVAALPSPSGLPGAAASPVPTASSTPAP